MGDRAVELRLLACLGDASYFIKSSRSAYIISTISSNLLDESTLLSISSFMVIMLRSIMVLLIFILEDYTSKGSFDNSGRSLSLFKFSRVLL